MTRTKKRPGHEKLLFFSVRVDQLIPRKHEVIRDVWRQHQRDHGKTHAVCRERAWMPKKLASLRIPPACQVEGACRGARGSPGRFPGLSCHSYHCTVIDATLNPCTQPPLPVIAPAAAPAVCTMMDLLKKHMLCLNFTNDLKQWPGRGSSAPTSARHAATIGPSNRTSIMPSFGALSCPS